MGMGNKAMDPKGLPVLEVLELELEVLRLLEFDDELTKRSTSLWGPSHPDSSPEDTLDELEGNFTLRK